MKPEVIDCSGSGGMSQSGIRMKPEVMGCSGSGGMVQSGIPMKPEVMGCSGSGDPSPLPTWDGAERQIYEAGGHGLQRFGRSVPSPLSRQRMVQSCISMKPEVMGCSGSGDPCPEPT